ncbi:hypothetical protein GCM10020254_84630 [Streptomyces goshikiensis]
MLAQTHTDLELLITDDASSDDSMDLLKELARQDERVLPEAAARQGARPAPGTWPSRGPGVTTSHFSTATTCGSRPSWRSSSPSPRRPGRPLTFTSYYKMDALYAGEAADFVPNGRVVWAPEHVDYRAMLVHDHIGALTAMYDRRVVGAKPMPDMPKRQDYALWLSIMRDGTPARALREPPGRVPGAAGRVALVEQIGARPVQLEPLPSARRALGVPVGSGSGRGGMALAAEVADLAPVHELGKARCATVSGWCPVGPCRVLAGWARGARTRWVPVLSAGYAAEPAPDGARRNSWRNSRQAASACAWPSSHLSATVGPSLRSLCRAPSRT